MIVIKVELVSAIHPSRSKELGRMVIANDGTGTVERGNYFAKLMRRGTRDTVQRGAPVIGFPRKSTAVWSLVARALKELGVR